MGGTGLLAGWYKISAPDNVPANLIPRLRVKNSLTHWALSSLDNFFMLINVPYSLGKPLLPMTWKDISAQVLINGVRFYEASTKGV